MPKSPTRESANHLRAWREYRGLTQEELAEAVGTSGNVISLLESGDRGLSQKWLNKIAPELKTRAGFLLEVDPLDPDVDMELLEAMLDLPKDRKAEAVQMIRILGGRGA